VAFCTKCGKQQAEGVRFCTKCGTPMYTAAPATAPPEDEPVVAPALVAEPVVAETQVPMVCTNCGKQIGDGATFCTGCGTTVDAVVSHPAADPPVEAMTAPTPEATPPVKAATQAPAFCTKCGRKQAEGARFCTGCGTPAFDATAPAVVPVPQHMHMEEIMPVGARKLALWQTGGGERRSFLQAATAMQQSGQTELFAEVPRLVREYPTALNYFGVEESSAVSALPELLLQRIIWRTLPLELQKETPEPVLYLSPYVELQAKAPHLKAIDDNPMMKGMRDFSERMEGRLLIPRKKAPKDSSATAKQLSQTEYKAFIAMEEWAIKKIVYDGLVAMCDALQFAQEFAEGQTLSSAFHSGAFEEEMKTLTSGLAMEVWFKQGTRNLWGPVIPNAQYEKILNEPIHAYKVRDFLKRICKKLDLDYNEISSKGAYKASYSIWWGGGGLGGALTGFSLLGKALDESSFKDAMAFVAYNTVVEKFNATYPAA